MLVMRLSNRKGAAAALTGAKGSSLLLGESLNLSGDTQAYLFERKQKPFVIPWRTHFEPQDAAMTHTTISPKPKRTTGVRRHIHFSDSKAASTRSRPCSQLMRPAYTSPGTVFNTSRA